MTVHIITYATHSEGLFDELINNKHNIKIKVLGWGEKWKGFMHKVQKCNEYIQSCPTDDIFIILDGFDTIVNSSNLDNCIQHFKDTKYKVLYSKNIENHNYGLERVVFEYCRGEYIVNCGMYMGYGKYLSILLNDITALTCKDDQVNVNSVCKKYDFLGIDETSYIFENMLDKKKSSDAMFIQYPGTLTVSRILRGLKEYPQFFMKYLVPFFIIIVAVLFYYSYHIISSIITIVVVLIFSYADYSCI
jgi:hypothetical protein